METCSFFTLADLLSRHPFFCFLVYCLLAELFFFVCLESSSCHLSGLFSRGGTAGEETRVALVALFARRSGNTVQKKNRTKRECGGGLDPGEEWLARVDILTFPEEGTGGTSRYLGR